eukprot:7144648-Prymnesium_polylepis.1
MSSLRFVCGFLRIPRVDSQRGHSGMDVSVCRWEWNEAAVSSGLRWTRTQTQTQTSAPHDSPAVQEHVPMKCRGTTKVHVGASLPLSAAITSW